MSLTVSPAELGDTVTVADAALMEEIGDHGRALYLKGDKLTAARRLEKRRYLKKGRLGDRYYELDELGQTFYEGRLRQRART